jgi:hypothetical protein
MSQPMHREALLPLLPLPTGLRVAPIGRLDESTLYFQPMKMLSAVGVTLRVVD